MTLKDRVWLIIIPILCMLVIAVFLFVHQINALFQIASIYLTFCRLVGGLFFIATGIKQLRQTHQTKQYHFWYQNLFIILGVVLILPLTLDFSWLWNKNIIGHTGVWLIDFVEIILVSVFLIFILSIEIVFTVGFIRYLLSRARLLMYSRQGNFLEEPPTEK